MTIHVIPDKIERLSANGKWAHRSGALRPDLGIKWGGASSRPKGPDAKVLASPLFNPALAPAGARLVSFGELEAGQCQWGFDVGGGNVFCGLPVDPSAQGSRLFRRYCPCHVKAATGRAVVR